MRSAGARVASWWARSWVAYTPRTAPAASVGLTLAALAAATAYGTGPIIILTAIPMLIIANAYRRLNMWDARCGASFEWVGRAINPYLGFQTGWLMVAAYILGTISGVFADRWPVKATLVSSDLTRAALCLLLLFVHSMAGFYLVLASISVVSSFFSPAQGIALRSAF